MTGRAWAWTIAVVLAVVALVAAGATVSSRRARTDSAYCTSCHDAERHPQPWRSAGGHDAVSCQSCHAVSFGATAKLAWSSLRGTPAPPHAAVDVRTCSSCHDSKSERGRLVHETAGHRGHAGLDKVDCLSCHKQSTHGPESAARSCTDCHDDDRLHKTAKDADSCTSCHNFALPKPGERRLTLMECIRCHADPKELAQSAGTTPPREGLLVSREMLHGGVDCKQCHQPHRAMPRDKPRAAPTAGAENVTAAQVSDPDGIAGGRVCRECHQIQIGTRGKPVPEGHENCVGCHGAHAPIDQFVVPCKDCHEEGRESARGPRSTALHHESCASCHVPHTWTAARSGCVQCHDEKASLLLEKSPAAHQDCTSCHAPHAPLPGGEACTSCHKERRGHLATAPSKHKNCASCHDPHAANVRPTASCAGCHTGQTRQVVSDGPEAHRKLGCGGCHQSHGSPRPSAGLCASCHKPQGKLVTSARPAEHRRCESCHKPHRFEVKNASAPCAACHQSIAAAPGAHDGACNKCHAPHGSPAVGRQACLGCHESIRLRPPAGGVAHANCGSCHEPHRPASQAPARCSSCHQDKAAVAKTWPAGSAHAGACNECHQPHAVGETKTCASCHSQQAASAKGGKHECKQCHAPHQQPPGAGKAWWQRCSSCHAPQSRDAKAGKVHADCNQCHKPHGFTTPSCNSCHKTATGKAGHRVKGHETCRDCHSTHSASLPSRAQCMRCHTDMTQHQPAAKSCQACHPFK